MPDHEGPAELLETCRSMLEETTRLILTKFRDPQSPFVFERFNNQWEQDIAQHGHWQQNRGVVGHNYKIAWNLTRVAHYYRCLATLAPDEEKAASYTRFATELEEYTTEIAELVTTYGLDQLRGGCFDTIERDISETRPFRFAWSNTKDFWQQEQAVLCYLIVYGVTGKAEHLDAAREMMAFWNLYFLDHDNSGIYFRTNDQGFPIVTGSYGQKAGHAVAGCHSFELNYLAHIYIRTYVRPEGRVTTPEQKNKAPVVDQNFCLFFRVDPDCRRRSINVLPDFMPPDCVEIASITVGGLPRRNFNKTQFQLELDEDDLDRQIVVEFRPLRGPNPAANRHLPEEGTPDRLVAGNQDARNEAAAK